MTNTLMKKIMINQHFTNRRENSMKLIDEVTTTDRFISFLEWIITEEPFATPTAIHIKNIIAKPHHFQDKFDEFLGAFYEI